MNLRLISRQAAPVVPLPAKKSITVSARVGRGCHNAPQDAQRFLRGVAGFLFAIGGHNGVPPGIGGEFAARCLFRSHQPGRHVGDALDLIHVVDVIVRVLGVPQDVVVLGRPLLAGARAVVVRPDDLVEEALPPKELVEQHLAVMHLAIVNVKVQAAVSREDASGFYQARFEEEQEVVKDVTVLLGADLGGGVTLPRKAGAVAAG